MKLLIVACVFLSVGFSTAAQSNEKIVQQQLEAYNNRDLEKFVAAYSDDIQLFRFPSELILEGKAQLRERYKIRFESPNLHAEIVDRAMMGDYIIDHERVSGINENVVEATVIYHIDNGLIDKMWLVIK